MQRKHVGTVALLAFFAAAIWLAYNVPISRSTGNPRDLPLTGEAATRQESARQESADRRQRSHYWFEQIEAGEATFSEAACEVDLHGSWNETADRCER
jgi:hypothetical protein